jgi:hypothetical protein
LKRSPIHQETPGGREKFIVSCIVTKALFEAAIDRLSIKASCVRLFILNISSVDKKIFHNWDLGYRIRLSDRRLSTVEDLKLDGFHER